MGDTLETANEMTRTVCSRRSSANSTESVTGTPRTLLRNVLEAHETLNSLPSTSKRRHDYDSTPTLPSKRRKKSFDLDVETEVKKNVGDSLLGEGPIGGRRLLKKGKLIHNPLTLDSFTAGVQAALATKETDVIDLNLVTDEKNSGDSLLGEGPIGGRRLLKKGKRIHNPLTLDSFTAGVQAALATKETDIIDLNLVTKQKDEGDGGDSLLGEGPIGGRRLLMKGKRIHNPLTLDSFAAGVEEALATNESSAIHSSLNIHNLFSSSSSSEFSLATTVSYPLDDDSVSLRPKQFVESEIPPPSSATSRDSPVQVEEAEYDEDEEEEEEDSLMSEAIDDEGLVAVPTEDDHNLSRSSIPVLEAVSTKVVSSVKATKKKRRAPKKIVGTMLPFSFTRENFQHFCRCRVNRKVLEAVHGHVEQYFDATIQQLVSSVHRKNGKTINSDDVINILKQQKMITKKEPLQASVRQYFPMEYRRLLVPVATDGNKVIP